MNAKECSLLLDYFNHQLSKEEKEAFEAHLAECESCQEELLELEELTADLPYNSEPVTPPEGMKSRVLSNVLEGNDQSKDEKVVPIPEKQRKSSVHRKKFYRPLLAAVLTLSLIGNGAAAIYISTNNEKNEPAPAPDSDNEINLDYVQKVKNLQPSEGFQAQATAMMIAQNDKTNLVIQAKGLPSVEGEETYQVWVLEEGKPYRAGTFIPNEEGAGGVSYVLDYKQDHNFDTIAITKEPDATSEKPKGAILLSSPL